MGVMGVVHKVASGPELAITMLVVVAAHLLFECGLVLLQLVQSMGEEAVLAVVAEPMFAETATQF